MNNNINLSLLNINNNLYNYSTVSGSLYSFINTINLYNNNNNTYFYNSINTISNYIISNNLELTSEIFNQYYYRFKRDLLKIRGFASRESLRYFIPLYKFCRRNDIKRDDIMVGLSGSKEFTIVRDIPRKGKRGHRFRTFRFDFTILSKK